MEKVKKKILKYIKKNVDTSFVEIENLFNEMDYNYKGNIAFANGTHPNVLYWSGWNQETMSMIIELLNDQQIEMIKCEREVYLIDGKSLKYPNPNSNMREEKEYWIPIVFNSVKGEGK